MPPEVHTFDCLVPRWPEIMGTSPKDLAEMRRRDNPPEKAPSSGLLIPPSFSEPLSSSEHRDRHAHPNQETVL